MFAEKKRFWSLERSSAFKNFDRWQRQRRNDLMFAFRLQPSSTTGCNIVNGTPRRLHDQFSGKP
jgi:hypothetical protein